MLHARDLCAYEVHGQLNLAARGTPACLCSNGELTQSTLADGSMSLLALGNGAHPASYCAFADVSHHDGHQVACRPSPLHELVGFAIFQ